MVLGVDYLAVEVCESGYKYKIRDVIMEFVKKVLI